MGRTKATARLCTGGAAQRISLTEEHVAAPAIHQTYAPDPSFNLQVSAHHVVEHL